ncbi:MAG: TRAP dicarboxylate transporter subunit DctM [Deltaproteobacteria bacterium CSP1-8]|nr:MAG: TRAP dicarboxylate transporter subunit DctM [Deltaproteobacteria bacterium CSP1-8]
MTAAGEAMDAPAGSVPGGGARSFLDKIENAVSIFLLCGMAALPLAEVVGRKLWRTGIPGSTTFVQHATLWIGFLGGALAARDGRHLSLGRLSDRLPARFRGAGTCFFSAVSAAITLILAWAGVRMVLLERAGGSLLMPYLPGWVSQSVIPAGFGLIAWRLIRHSSPSWSGRAATGAGTAAAVVFLSSGLLLRPAPFAVSLILLLSAVVLGGPLFVGLGGLAVIFFLHADVPIASIPVEIYRLVTSPTLPTIPLFTFAGYLLTTGNVSRRLVRFFRALVGWMPGAIAVVTVLVCSFFTTFTGASGVTIIALGGILLPALLAERYPEKFSLGLLTASGSLGLLFPPCLPVILYAVVAGIAVDQMFLGGLLPGVLLVTIVAAWAVRGGKRAGTRRTPFSLGELGAAAWEAKWDLLLPVIVLLGIFGGFATMVEAASITVLYAFCVEVFVQRDIDLRRQFPEAGAESARLVGGFLILLAAATGLTGYLVDAGVPQAIFEWVRATIHSKYAFLLILNGFLLVVGCLMHIFSAIVVVVPIIAPLAAAFDIHPVHLGIIFLANLELGFLMPPVGMNLFLSAYRFDRSLGEVTRSVIPFLLILLLGVLAITYVPALSTILLPG